MFSRDLRVGEQSSQTASVEFACAESKQTVCAAGCIPFTQGVLHLVRGQQKQGHRPCLFFGINDQDLPSALVFSKAAMTASITVERKAPSSRALTPMMVLPPGEQTWSLSTPGC